MPTVRGPKSLTRNFQRHSGISSSHATSSISSIWVVSSAAAPPTIAKYTIPSLRIGSIASSGKPPLPQIARTPYSRPSGSVNRTIRALVVVPMQTFSYLPGPSFRTPGAVCSRNAPRRSIGDSSSSTGPRREPERLETELVTQSYKVPAVPRSELPVVVDVAVGADVGTRAPGRPALVVDRDGIQRHVRVRVLDVALED